MTDASHPRRVALLAPMPPELGARTFDVVQDRRRAEAAKGRA